jgi:hypothetical protein
LLLPPVDLIYKSFYPKTFYDSYVSLLRPIPTQKGQ